MNELHEKKAELSARAITQDELDGLIQEFDPESIANILDECFIVDPSGLKVKERAAEKITELLLGNARPLVVAFVATGTDRPRETVENWGFFQLAVGIQQVAAKTYPGWNFLEIGNHIIERVIAVAAPTSASASGNLSRN
ncbi:hypothetical protein [Pararhizobium gei]|uniref:hypothetical protein n=1 Tax=Pararhizobium gei TaxID=1395951 RepID=UPI0023DB4B75|nr:hypothetical protein [Rhizobium gei]